MSDITLCVPAAARTRPAGRWPRGYGLVVAAMISLALWVGLARLVASVF